MPQVDRKSSRRQWLVDKHGILDSRYLPDDDFETQWKAIIIDQDSKDELLSHGILNFTLRPRVPRALIPLHGILLLVGPPGTGKTSLARGLASRIASSVKGLGDFRYLEVEPHALASAALGRSQKSVTELFGQTIAEHADGPLIVLLDEVETLAASRSKMSLDANPIDVHRATDAVLTQLDHLADTHKQLLFLATSNFPGAIDAALLSRADLVRTIGLPNSEACQAILTSTIAALAEVYPHLKALRMDTDIASAANVCEGLDGRQIRKLVVSACARRKDLALDPSSLTGLDVLEAAKAAKAEQGRLLENSP